MQRRCFRPLAAVLVCLTISMALADQSSEEAIKQDRKSIEGRWNIVAMEVNGNVSKKEDMEKLSVINEANGEWRLLVDGKELSRGTSQIDPSKKPKTIDFSPTMGESKGSQFRGIYELGEKSRKLRFAPAGRERPTEFVSKAGTEHILVTFERIKNP